MSRLALLISVPHAGLQVPPEVKPFCRLGAREIAEDGDGGAAEIYRIEPEVQAYVTTDVARAIVDLNRAEDDRGTDGVVKTHTCWNVPVYDPFPPPWVVERLLERYYRPYHARLRELAAEEVKLGVDCHTMAAIGPPIGPMAGEERPKICLSDLDGLTLPRGWMGKLAESFAEAFGFETSINHPFKGGHIVRVHAAELPWVQVEFSRAPFLPDALKRERLLQALRGFCARLD